MSILNTLRTVESSRGVLTGSSCGGVSDPWGEWSVAEVHVDPEDTHVQHDVLPHLHSLLLGVPRVAPRVDGLTYARSKEPDLSFLVRKLWCSGSKRQSKDAIAPRRQRDLRSFRT